MTFVIADPCIGTKDTACVEVCPVDCIHEAEDESSEMLYIDPAECIDCAACVPACPVEAIFAEADLPAKWSKFTQMNADFFTSAAAAPAAAPSSGGAKPAAPKKAPEPEPLVPLQLNAEEMYQSLSELRGDLSEQRRMSDAALRARKSPVAVALVAVAILVFAFAILNNFSKATNYSLFGRIGSAAIGKKKPSLGGSEFTIARKIGGKRYMVKVSDSIFGARTLTLQAPAPPFKGDIYHKDEKYFKNLVNQDSRFYYIFIDEKSNGSLDSVLEVMEFWSKDNHFLGRYQKPIEPTDELQSIYRKEAGKIARSLGLAKSGA